MIKYGTYNIGSLYFGSNPIGKAYLGSNLVFSSGSGPSPVTTISYIRGGADGAYINTGISPDNTTKVIVWARNWNASSDCLFGVGGGATGSTNTYFITQPASTETGKIHLDYGTVGSPWASIEGFKYSSGYHKYELYAGVVKIDDVDRITGSTTATISTQYPIHLFGKSDGSGGHTNMKLPVDICACKIYKNNVLVRDFTAVNSPSVGLYDAVSGTVFTNAGSGSFTYGTFNPNAYTPLEYIACDAQEHFDSGVYGTYSEGFVTKFMPTNTTPTWSSLCGFRTSTNCCDISFGTATTGEDNMRIYWRFGTNDTSGQAYSGTTSSRLTNVEVVAVKNNATLTVYKNNSQIGTNAKTGVSSSFQTANTLGIGRLRTADGFSADEGFVGRIYYFGFGATANFVPAKVNGVAGMYDTYNDVFYLSVSGTDFTAGPEL